MADYFDCSADGTELEIDAQTHGQAIEQLVEAVEEESGLVCCAGPRLDSESGRTFYYEFTLGQPVESGGYSPVRTVQAVLRGCDRE